MEIEIGAPVVIVPGWDSIWHLPCPDGIVEAVWGRPIESHPTVCGLDGSVYAYRSIVRGLRFCPVCRENAPALHAIPDRPIERRGRARKTSLAIA